MPRFSLNSAAQLRTCVRELQDVFADAIEIVEFKILEGHRGEAAQNEALAKGNTTKPWPTGKHNKNPSDAVDFAPVYFDKGSGKIDWDDLVAFGRIAGVLQACAFRRGIKLRFGLDWDGDFRSVNRDPDENLMDAPHVEIVQ